MSEEIIPWGQAPETAIDRAKVLKMTAKQINKDLLAEVIQVDKLNDIQEAEFLLKAVTEFIAEVQRSQPERLVEIFYRVDIPEQRVQLIFAQEQPDTIARNLSVLLIQREVQKVFSRLQYTNL